MIFLQSLRDPVIPLEMYQRWLSLEQLCSTKHHSPLFTSSAGVWTAAVTTYSANKLSASFQLLTKTSSNILQVNWSFSQGPRCYWCDCLQHFWGKWSPTLPRMGRTRWYLPHSSARCSSGIRPTPSSGPVSWGRPTSRCWPRRRQPSCITSWWTIPMNEHLHIYLEEVKRVLRKLEEEHQWQCDLQSCPSHSLRWWWILWSFGHALQTPDI